MTPDYPKPPSNDSFDRMGGQTPIFFSPSSFIVGHKPQDNMTFEAMLATCPPKQLSRGPLQLVDFKEVGGGEGRDERVIKGPLIYSNCNYEAAKGAGEEVSMELYEEGDYNDGVNGGGGGKKGSTRRLGYEQVKSLEKAFELENKLEPERKVRLASQLGLQPRQVAVWFQNRRARWKTKQMERDYTLLKNKFEALKADRDKLLQEKDHLHAELARLKGHLVERKKAATQGDQDSPTLASCSLVDDAPNQANHVGAEDHAEKASPDRKLENADSLSSTEDSDNNNGAIEESTNSILQCQASSKALNDEPDFYNINPWRLPPSHILYKTNIKNEEWENAETGSFNMPIDWYW